MKLGMTMFAGEYCETVTDPCRSRPCGVNGTCALTDEVGVHRCTACGDGYQVSNDSLKCIGNCHSCRCFVTLQFCSVLLCSLAVLDPRVSHTTDVLSPFISVLCHSD